LYNESPVRILGLLSILQKDKCEEVKGRIGAYPASYFIIPKVPTMKHLKEGTQWSGINNSIGGMVFLRDGNELYEWQNRSVTRPVEQLGFTHAGNGRLVIIINVTGTGFTPNQARTILADPKNADPFPHDCLKAAPRKIKELAQQCTEGAVVRTGVKQVERWAVHIVRTFGTMFLDRRGKFRTVTPTGEMTGVEKGFPPNPTPTIRPGWHPSPDPANPMPKLRPAQRTAEEMREDAKKGTRKRVSQRTGVPNIEKRIVNTPGSPAVRIIADTAGAVIVELNYGADMVTRLVTRCPDLVGYNAKTLCEALQTNGWLDHRVLGILFFRDEPVIGDVSYILDGVADICRALRSRERGKEEKANAAGAGL
jgi:hypothetical protein